MKRTSYKVETLPEQAVIEMKALLDKSGIVEPVPALRNAAGQAFYHTSRSTTLKIWLKLNGFANGA